MAVYLDIKKALETSVLAVYTYATTDGRTGEFELVKSSGEIRIRSLAEGDEDERLFRRAAHKIAKHFREGELPEATCWAS